MELLLGSQSPRRKELLASLGFGFKLVSIDCEETFPKDLACGKVAAFLAQKKNKAFGEIGHDQVLMTSDTIVVCEDKVLGKPQNLEEAKQMLGSLSNKHHWVHTAVCVRDSREMRCETSDSYIEMDEINDAEICYYLQNFLVLDKAGAYGIQDWLGMAKIKQIKGSFYGVMGFPTDMVYRLLLDFNVKIKMK